MWDAERLWARAWAAASMAHPKQTLWLLFMVSLIVAATTASAEVRINTIGCDTLSFSPLQIQSTFTVSNLGGTEVCEILLTPLLQHTDADSCHVVDASGPSGWSTCSVENGASWFARRSESIGYDDCLLPGESLELLAIVLAPAVCGHLALFFDELGSTADSDLIFFPCDQPVQIQSATWGRVKAIYR